MDPSPPPAEPATRRRPRIGWRRWGPRAVFESLLIVFSLVLALGVTGWAEDRRDRERAEDMRGFLRQEIAANRDLLVSDPYLPHHRRLRQILEDAAQSEARTTADLEPTFREVGRSGVHFTPLDDSVWSSLAGSEVMEHMQPEEVFRLAQVYRLQQDLQTINTSFYPQVMSIPGELERGDPPRGAVIRLSMYFNDVVGAEQQLVRRYDEALAMLDAPLVRAAPAATRKDDAAPATG